MIKKNTDNKENQCLQTSKRRFDSIEALNKKISDLQEQISVLQEQLSKFAHDFEVFVTPKNLAVTFHFVNSADWTFSEVCKLYKFTDNSDPGIDIYPIFLCGRIELKDKKSQIKVKHLMS
ncbi:5080_t:CDS:2, partial [Scutellospora calospora]